MLKTNSKQAKINIKKYIINNYKNEEVKKINYDLICNFIYKDFTRVSNNNINYEDFKKYAYGLPNQLFNYLLGGESFNALKNILEETEEEANKYINYDCDNLLTTLIYKAVKDNIKF